MADNATPAAEESTPKVPREFLIRVNDFLEMANRIERRSDSNFAEVTLLQAFSRYSAHFYLKSTDEDTQEKRERFAELLSADVRRLVAEHLNDMAGEKKPADAAPSLRFPLLGFSPSPLATSQGTPRLRATRMLMWVS